MENLFKNTTTLTLNTRCGLEEFQYGLSKPKRYIICLIALVILFWVKQHDFVEDFVSASVNYMVALLTLVLFMWALRKLHKFLYKKNLKTDKRFASPVEAEYMFSEDSFSYAIGANQGSMEYKLLYKVYESNDFFYLFVNRMEAYIVGKDGFTSGSPEQFRNFMMSKMGKKFSNRTTKKKRNNLN